MDESSLHHNGPGQPDQVGAHHPAAWFASYQRFLRPYARMAEQQRIPEFFTGAEFDRFGSSPYWAKLDSYLRRYYHGALAYANNWEIAIPRAVDRHQVAQTADAYPPMSAASRRERRDSHREVGPVPEGKGPRRGYLRDRDSRAGLAAYAKPFRLRWTGEPLDTAIQVRWFTAACNAMVNVHGGGIYFWSLNFGQQLNSPPTAADPTAFADGPGAGAISACFKRLR